MSTSEDDNEVSVTNTPTVSPPLVAVRPEPAVDVDGLERGGVAALVQEVALAAAGPHRRDVV